jgi:hypothetical protein
MRQPFNVEHWASEMRIAIAAKNAEWLAELMQENDKNGVFYYEDYCREFGVDITTEEWAESTIACAENMLSQLESELR